MSDPISLVLLRCVKCSTPVPAEPNEIAWTCQTCGTGNLLHEDHGLEQIKIHYSAGIPQNVNGRPFWVVPANVDIDRKTYTTFRKRTNDAERFWAQKRTFFIPAYSVSIDDMILLGTHYLRSPVELEDGGAVPFLPITQKLEDIQALAEFLVMGVEAERSDKVKTVNFTMKLNEPELWILT